MTAQLWPQDLARNARALISRLRRRIEERRDAARDREYVDALKHSGDAEAVLEAVGASREQLDSCDCSPIASAASLQGMLARLGYTHLDAGEVVLEEVRLRCRTCAHEHECREWTSGEGGIADYRGFCPNAVTLDAFGVRKRR